MPTFTIEQAEAQFDELIKRVETGEEIILLRDETPVAILCDYKGREITEQGRQGIE